MRAVVDNAVHVEVKTVEFWYAILCDQLRDRRISFAHPSEELGDTHSVVCAVCVFCNYVSLVFVDVKSSRI